MWVEVFHQGQWIKTDPTEWIAPDRVRLGGDAFVESISGAIFSQNSKFRLPQIFNDLRHWFGQWDFHFYQWLEEMDYHSQEMVFEKFHLKRRWLFSIIPLVTFLFMLIYIWYVSTKNKKVSSPHQDLWILFLDKMKKRGYKISYTNISETQKALLALNDPGVLNVFHQLVSLSFEGKDLSMNNLRKRIRSL